MICVIVEIAEEGINWVSYGLQLRFQRALLITVGCVRKRDSLQKQRILLLHQYCHLLPQTISTSVTQALTCSQPVSSTSDTRPQHAMATLQDEIPQPVAAFFALRATYNFLPTSSMLTIMAVLKVPGDLLNSFTSISYSRSGDPHWRRPISNLLGSC